MKVADEQLGQILLPDFLLVGAAKSATTSLHFYLDQHPEIRMASVKESWFFSFRDHPPEYKSPVVLNNLITDLGEYVRLFDGAAESQTLGDASPSYLYTYRDTIRNVREVYPPDAREKLKIIISLREPVSRAFSQYYTFRRDVREPLGFEEAINEETIKDRLANNWNIFYDYIGFGRYYEQVKAFQEEYGEENVLILFFDDIKRDPVAASQRIFGFLGVDDSFVPDTSRQHNDISGEPRQKWLVRLLTSRNPVKRAVTTGLKAILLRLPRKPTEAFIYGIVRRLVRREGLDPGTRRRVSEKFSDDIEKLEKHIGKDLSHWRDPV